MVGKRPSSIILRFLSTLSLRRATETANTSKGDIQFLSTLSLRRATSSKTHDRHKTRISIHALLAESDEENTTQQTKTKAFLSTLSLRRATFKGIINRLMIGYFYPRSPCGERLQLGCRSSLNSIFLSTLSLRRATRYGRPIDVQLVFLSTLSLRRATGCSVRCRCWVYFYPRSPCGERPFLFLVYSKFVYFYPRSPCGERQWEGMKSLSEVEFLSTLSLRRATFKPNKSRIRNRISIHALLAESDRFQGLQEQLF